MLDGILGRGFSFKCKSLIKTTRARIEVVRKRADVKQRFLREDLAKLLSNGLDINAYGRTEEFVAGMNLLFCYDFVEQCCELTVKQLSRMQKQGECPEECREPVACLMYAAARFSDLPELRELRDIFEQKYGNYLEAFVNQKFVEKLSSRPPTSDKRLEVLLDIASAFSIKWDSRGFERRMAAPSVVAQVGVQKVQKVDVAKQSPGLLEEKKSRIQEGGDRRDKTHHHYYSGRNEVVECKEKSSLTRDVKQSHPIEKSTGRVGPSNGIGNPRKREIEKEALFREKVEPRERIENNIPSYPLVKSKDINIPCPPYMKTKEDNNGTRHDQTIEPEKEQETIPSLPRPRSTRTKHHKSSNEEEHKGGVPSRRKEHSRNLLHHRKDDEERMIDKLLMHYSKKPSSYEDTENLRRKSPRKKMNPESSAAHPTRSISLPHEQIQHTSPQLEKKDFARANSFEPDRNQARHVHPKLPDYDDLAARFAALKG